MNPLQAQPFSLAGSGAIIGATTIVLKSFKTIDGVNITMAMLGSIAFFTLEPGNGVNEEQISITGVTQNPNGTATLTGVSSVTFETPYTATPGTLKAHAGSTIAILSNTSGFYNEFVTNTGNQTFTGLINFPSGANNPTIGTVYVAPTTDIQIATKGYVDSVAIAGAPDASTTVKGITKLSVTPVSLGNPIAVGDNDPRLPSLAAIQGNDSSIPIGAGNKFVTQTGLQKGLEMYAVTGGAPNAYTLTLSPAPVAYTDGQVIYFQANSTNTGASTMNVNGLGVRPLVRPAGGGALQANDLLINNQYEAVYSTTTSSFNLLSGTGNVLYTNSNGSGLTGVTLFRTGVGTHNIGAGAFSITHGLGAVPKYFQIISIVNITNGVWSSTGVYDGVTQSVSYYGFFTSGGSGQSFTGAGTVIFLIHPFTPAVAFTATWNATTINLTLLGGAADDLNFAYQWVASR